MLRKIIGTSVVALLLVGFAFAEEFRAAITKVEDGKVTFKKSMGKGKLGDAETLPTADDVKVVKGKRNADDKKKIDAGDALEGGLKNEKFKDIDQEKGVGALIITDADNKKITEIRVLTK